MPLRPLPLRLTLPSLGTAYEYSEGVLVLNRFRHLGVYVTLYSHTLSRAIFFELSGLVRMLEHSVVDTKCVTCPKGGVSANLGPGDACIVSWQSGAKKISYPAKVMDRGIHIVHVLNYTQHY
jgi:hypothetical protein